MLTVQPQQPIVEYLLHWYSKDRRVNLHCIGWVLWAQAKRKTEL